MVPINPIIAAAKRATTTIPIVMLYAVDPVAAGLVASFAKPGGNITGLTMGQGPEALVKNLQLLKEASPHISTVVVLSNPDAPDFAPYLRAVEASVRPLARSALRCNAKTSGRSARSARLFRLFALIAAADCSSPGCRGFRWAQ